MAPSQVPITSSLATAEFANNRAEQVGPDVTGSFIAPPFLLRNRLDQQRQSVRLMGGRGCGKTMFLRFFSHHSQLSPEAGPISSGIFQQGIGLYWRADTGFCDLLKPQWLGEQIADAAFRHHVAIVVIETFCDFLDRLSNAPLEGSPICIEERALPAPVQFVLKSPMNYRELKLWATERRLELSNWAQNPDGTKPTFRRVDELLDLLCEDIAKADSRLESVYFRVFVDEFENLKDNQRRIICDLLKHPSRWFSFNFAMRRDSVDSFLTSSGEQVVDVHDFRTISLEDEFRQGDDFELMAAEMLLMKLQRIGWPIECDSFDVARLHDPSRLIERTEVSYRRDVKNAARRILPSVSATDLATQVFEPGGEALLKRLLTVAEQGLKRHTSNATIGPGEFLISECPAASIVAPFILNRKKTVPSALLEHLREYAGSSSAKSQFTDWIHNNLVGCLLYLYFGLPQRANPLYAGFDSFCTLSTPNLRFFNEFCYSSLRIMSDLGGADSVPARAQIPVISQAFAAKEASELLLQKVAQLGDEGRRLQRVVKRLGRLFQVAQQRMTQSEAEINHFSIDEANREALSKETQDLLKQARIWSVIYEENDTKNKSDNTAIQTDFVPNPIFNPAFRISYRRKKKLVLNASEVNAIASGTDEEFEKILNKYKAQWDHSSEIVSGDLFE